jgi:hypothetical protein
MADAGMLQSFAAVLIEPHPVEDGQGQHRYSILMAGEITVALLHHGGDGLAQRRLQFEQMTALASPRLAS